MRCFLALELPRRVSDDIGRRLDSLREDFPPARWVRPANYHLTLFFLGDLGMSQAGRLGAKLAPVFEAASTMRLALRGAGCFPPHGRARVIWLGFEAQADLAELAAKVAGICAREIDRPPDTRPYRPHLTVARCRKPWPRATAERLVKRLQAFPRHEIVANRAVLMESKAGSYRVVSSFPLGDRGPV